MPSNPDAPGPVVPQGPAHAALGTCGAFELLVELASGGMATVFLARSRDARDAPLVALKRPHRHLAGDKTFLAMLVDEARLASAISHPNVVKVREHGLDASGPFIVMDYVEGGSLAELRSDLSERGRALEPRVALRIALDALAGLEAAHTLRDQNGRSLGIVHRDVSPHNVLVGCDGAARLTDFGIAKAADRVQVTRTHEVKGKLAYVAPERIDRRRICTPQSDVFSMAVVLWETIAGRRLFRGEEALETLQEVVSAPIPSLRKMGAPISPALDEAIQRGLARDLDVRFRTAAELAEALELAAGERGVASRHEVAELASALFGERLRLRHEALRRALGERDDVSRVLELSGLCLRAEATDEERARERLRLEALPLAPSAPEPVGAPSGRRAPLLSKRTVAVAAGALVALLGGLGVVVARRPADAGASVAPSPSARVVSGARRVIVTLPFPASRVTFDDRPVDIAQASSAVVVDVPNGSGRRHRVVAVAPDGARAEASVVEDDGVARPDGEGFVIETLDTLEPGSIPLVPDATVPRARGPRRGAPTAVGTVKGGFTKIR